MSQVELCLKLLREVQVLCQQDIPFARKVQIYTKVRETLNLLEALMGQSASRQAREQLEQLKLSFGALLGVGNKINTTKDHLLAVADQALRIIGADYQVSA